MKLRGMQSGYTLFYADGEMNLNYFSYRRHMCFRGIEDGYGEPWAKLRKRGFTVRKIVAKEAISTNIR